MKIKLTVLTDSTAAKGIASRRGLGKVRHIEVNQLWVQEKVANGDIELNNVGTGENLADSLTKHVDNENISATCVHRTRNPAWQTLDHARRQLNRI